MKSRTDHQVKELQSQVFKLKHQHHTGLFGCKKLEIQKLQQKIDNLINNYL
jgi:hypothetical protein